MMMICPTIEIQPCIEDSPVAFSNFKKVFVETFKEDFSAEIIEQYSQRLHMGLWALFCTTPKVFYKQDHPGMRTIKSILIDFALNVRYCDPPTF